MNRINKIIKISFIGIITNILLVVIKGIIGFLSGSISILMDALNNLTDALSSIVTILGTALSSKSPNKKHPYGYGKIEYLSSLAIALIILTTGISSLIESIKKVINPTLANYTLPMLVIIILTIITKYILGKYYITKGKELNSSSLIASGTDAKFDSLISFSTLIGAIITYVFSISIEGYLGIFIGLMILKSASEIISDSFNNIIGTRIDDEVTNKIKESINSYPEILGSYDLILHQYGPTKIIGSIHIEINDSLTAKEIHTLTRNISEKIFKEFGIILTIGIYASNTASDEYTKIKETINNIIKDYDNILQMHGYYVNSETNFISFDLVFDFKEKNPEIIKDEIISKLNNYYQNYTFNIIIDTDY